MAGVVDVQDGVQRVGLERRILASQTLQSGDGTTQGDGILRHWGEDRTPEGIDAVVPVEDALADLRHLLGLALQGLQIGAALLILDLQQLFHRNETIMEVYGFGNQRFHGLASLLIDVRMMRSLTIIRVFPG